MPATSSVSRTGNLYIDGLLAGTKWAVSSLTYGFPTVPSQYGTSYGSNEPWTNFEALNATQQMATKSVLAIFASVVNLRFLEAIGPSSAQADLRYGESDRLDTAWAYLPNVAPEGGDTWLNNSGGRYDNPEKGNYAWATFLHETAHALGLKHPHETEDRFGPTPQDHDSLEYTVMSYRSYVGANLGGYTNASADFPHTLMMDDIAALQTLYGANYSTNSGNTVYRWSPSTGEMFVNGEGQGRPAANKIFMTVWDGGGTDTYDFSTYGVSLTVDLAPGRWSQTSATQLPDLDFRSTSHLAAGNIANALLHRNDIRALIENALGGSAGDTITGNFGPNFLSGNAGADRLYGEEGEDLLSGGAGNDILNGGEGFDTARFSGNSADYRVARNADATWTVSDLRSGSPDGVDNLADVEHLDFADIERSLVASAQRGTAGRDRFLNDVSDERIDGLAGLDTFVYARPMREFSITRTEGGDLIIVAGQGGSDTLINIERIQFTDLTVAFDMDGNAGEAYRLYEAAFNRTPDRAGLSYWTNLVDDSLSLHEVASSFLASGEFRTLYGANTSNEAYVQALYQNVLDRELDQPGYDYWISRMNSGLDRAEMLISFSESDENQQNVIGAIQNGILLDTDLLV